MNAIEIYENAIRMFEINGEITLGEFEEMIKPLEDVAPVVHGRWIDNGLDSWDGSTYYFRQCNSCGYERDDCNPDYDTPYCPNCGARMDGAE